MIKKNYKGRCEKRVLSKCKDVCKTYNAIQYAYADKLENNKNIKEFQCNVPLTDLADYEYTTDFLCISLQDELIIRECVQRTHLTKPMTVKLLDISMEYWIKRGADWGIVINGKE